MAAWVIRAGASGEDEDWNLTTGRSGVGFPEVDDLSHCTTRDDVRAVIEAAFPDAPKGQESKLYRPTVGISTHHSGWRSDYHATKT